MAAFKLSTHIAAEAETLEAAEWYRERSEVAAFRFGRALDSKIEEIVEHPDRWPLFEAGTRRAVLSSFPYSVVYRVRGEVVEIVAIMHQRRQPGYWADR